MLSDAFRRLVLSVQGIDAGEPDVRELLGIRAASALLFTMKDRVCPVYVSDVSISQPPDVSALADGAGHVLLMLTAGVFADAEGRQLLEIEEPENSIHPWLLQGFLSALPQPAGSSRILMAANSPYIVERVSPEVLYIGRTESGGPAVFSWIKGSKVRELPGECRQSGESLGSYIFELLSGSADGRAILTGYLED